MLENAVEGTFIARLEAVDPDPGDTFSYSFATINGAPANAGGRFRIDGANLMVAHNSAFDFDAADSHSVTLQATDHFGNTFLKTISIAVRDTVDVFSPLSVTLPAGAEEVRLWELEAGGYVVTWRVTDSSTFLRHYARVVDDAGNGLPAPGQPEGSPPAPDRLLAEATPGDVPRLLGVDDNGVAALVSQYIFPTPGIQAETHTDRLVWIDTRSGTTVATRTFNDSAFSEGGTDFRNETAGYLFDDGQVLYTHTDSSSSFSYADGGYGSAGVYAGSGYSRDLIPRCDDSDP